MHHQPHLPLNPASSELEFPTVLQPQAVTINPEMISMARLATGFTQEECARAIGISQGKLSKIEDGLTNSIDVSCLELLSKLTGYPQEFFQQPGSRRSMGDGFFRKRATIPAKIFNRTEALINIKRMEISKLARKIETENIKDRPRWEVERFRDGARQIARHLRHYWSIPNGPIADLMRIVEDAGIIVVFFDFGTSKIDGLTVYCDDGTPLILLSPHANYVRQRSTLSHELGHVIMHSMPTPDMEEEAFDFASEFMMPEAEIRPALFPLNLDKLLRLKLRWKTSMQWILKWANKLGVVKDSYYRALMVKIAQEGWRKVEPYDTDWKPESPTFLKEIIDYIRQDLSYSFSELQKLILSNQKTFQADYLGNPGLSIVK